ncbi:MAG: 3-dehydroquinate synthase [Anaerolineales bacterium]|nr:3-dehydroquinate synthase [Anaerolineales bacterium]
MPRNIVLTGFMGTGKSTVGRLVAAELGREFVDMDTLIEQREGRSIRQIFAESGVSYFRQLDADLCRELAQQKGLVIATGGGALLPEANLRVMESGGLVICLDCDPTVLWQRIGRSEDRPMLAAQDETRFARLAALLEQRAPAYGRIKHHLDVTHLSPVEAARRICEWANGNDKIIRPSFEEKIMQTITVTHPSGSYPIFLGEGALAETGPYLAELGYRGRCAVVSNEPVGQHHAEPLLASLRRAGFEPVYLTIPDGEPFKTLATVAGLYSQLVEARLDRRSPIVALGGGVLGDTVGFAVATYLRGVPFVQIPTTLLAMVDASVGGKVGVDLPQGKNLVGAFKQPEMVIIDPQVLATLPPAEFRAGLAEMVKHGIIDSPALFEALEERSGGAGGCQRGVPGGGSRGDINLSSLLLTPYSLLPESIGVKVRVVQEDPFEQGRRAVLNLGHTFGHAFERLANFEIRHGEGVAMGLACAARLAVRLGYCAGETAARITALLARLGLPTSPPPYPPAEIWAAMGADKKRQGDKLRFILPRAIGNVAIFDNVAREDVEAILTR